MSDQWAVQDDCSRWALIAAASWGNWGRSTCYVPMSYVPEVLALCDNCELPVTEDDDFLFDAEGYVHEECNG